MLNTSRSLSKDNSKSSLYKKIAQTHQIPRDYQLETKDRAVFGLCDLNDIDNYFEGLCKESKTKLSAVHKVTNYIRSNPYDKVRSPVSGGSKSDQPKTPVSGVHNEERKSILRNTLIEEGREMSPSALGRKRVIGFTTTWSHLDDEALQLLKEFGISQAQLTAIETEEGKEKYVLMTMKRKLDEEYDKWKKEIEKREKEIQKIELTNEQKRQKFEREKADVFPWLKLKTKFPFLKRSLKLGLMEVLNDVDNQKDIERSLDEIRSRSRDKSTMSSARRINLEHIPIVDNNQILADVLGNSEAIFKINKTFRKKKTSIAGRGEAIHPETARSASSVAFTFTSQSSIERDHHNTTADTNAHVLRGAVSKMSLPTDRSSTHEGASQYVWDPEAEYEFKDHKEEARARMFNNIKSSSWNEVGLAPFIQKTQKEEKLKSQRNHVLARYRQGEALTTREYADLAHTSLFLNSYSDTHFIQSVVNQLEPQIVEAVEIDLAQKIIHDYQKNRSQMQKARMEYLHDDNLRNKKRVQSNDEAHARLIRVAQGKEEQSRMLREMVQKYENYEKRRKEKSPNDGHGAHERREEMKRSLSREKSQNGKDALVNKKKFQLVDVKSSKRLFHPNSKILITYEDRPKDFLGLAPNIVDPKLLKRANEDPKEYALQIHNNAARKSKKLFSKYYSGGPPEYEYDSNSGYYANELPRFKGTAIEHKMATILKAHVKGFLERAKFQATKRHILDDRKAIRTLKHGEEGLPDILKAVFLALTEDKLDSPIKKTKSYHDSKAKAIIVEMQQKDPILFRQFQREVMKQYYYYQMTHHRNRTAMPSTEKASGMEEEKRTLINSLKNALVVINSQSHYASMILDDAAEETETHKKNESINHHQQHQPHQTAGTGPNFQRKHFASPTVIMDALFTLDGDDEKEKHKQDSRPQTATHRLTKTVGNQFAIKKTVVGQSEKPKLIIPGLRNLAQLAKTSHPATTQARVTIKSKEDVRKDVEEEMKIRAEKIAHREPPKGLLLKQRKLLTTARANNLTSLKAQGYPYSEVDANVKDDWKNTPLYYTAKAGNLEFCQFLTDLGARVNEPCEKGNTPLHMAFLSDNDAVVILLLIKGGNLNILNDEGFTPLAFGTERLLTLLDLKSGVATFNKQGKNLRELPAEYDNNYLVNRGNWKKQGEEDTAEIKYRSLDSPRDSIRKGDQSLSHYLQPQNISERLTTKHKDSSEHISMQDLQPQMTENAEQ